MPPLASLKKRKRGVLKSSEKGKEREFAQANLTASQCHERIVQLPLLGENPLEIGERRTNFPCVFDNFTLMEFKMPPSKVKKKTSKKKKKSTYTHHTLFCTKVIFNSTNLSSLINIIIINNNY